ncbi:MAG: PDR/VanB family oxidoreductase [Gordonia sp. (in: high G+C Gram-positive bacteria)]|uniref:PDR/VanB family oxidoreductase n=1 Tax=Gordonia sp. (in: high G+C Gram-positive bacteria) TaxID=84139 RepID=UPI0039E22FD6
MTVTAHPSTSAVRRPPDTLTLTVAGIDEPAPDIRSFTLTAPDGAGLPGFVPGSHLPIRTGAGTVNAYSLTGDGIAPNEYTVSVLRVTGGAGGSRWLHERVAVGDELTVEIPRSAFAPIAAATRHLLIAGGIGVTPILSHLRAAHRWGRPVQVMYAFGEGRAAHLHHIAELAGPAAEFFDDRAEFTARLARTLVEQPIGTHLYVCGPGPMIDHVVESARAAGWPPSRIHFERFGVGALDPGEPFTVALTESGARVEVPSGVSLLEALEENGVEVPNLCRQGVCGQCRIPLTGGTPVHRDLYLSDDEKAAGTAIMPCVSRADRHRTLEVPL